jgi:hypothetical protein
MSYWDTSCLLKLYVAEPDSALFEAHAATGQLIVSSFIGECELWTTLRRKEAEGSLSAGAAAALLQLFRNDVAAGEILLIPAGEFVQAEFEAMVARCHGGQTAIPIRTLDALHLAAARMAGETEVVSTDLRQRQAAVAEGFGVFPPP